MQDWKVVLFRYAEEGNCKVGLQGPPWQIYSLGDATEPFLFGSMSLSPMSRTQEPEVRAHPWFIPLDIVKWEQMATKKSVRNEEDDKRMFEYAKQCRCHCLVENGGHAPTEDLEMFSEYRQALAVFLHL